MLTLLLPEEVHGYFSEVGCLLLVRSQPELILVPSVTKKVYLRGLCFFSDLGVDEAIMLRWCTRAAGLC